MSYTNGWLGGNLAQFANGKSYFGIRQPVGWPMGGPLFFTHYSFLGFDPRSWRAPECDYFENNRAITRIHHAYALRNPGRHTGYGEGVWGLTASDGPVGYKAHEPRHDDGTVAPTAALASIPYTPPESLATLKHYYHALGKRLWGDFGFKDAFNLDRDWFAESYLAIVHGQRGSSARPSSRRLDKRKLTSLRTAARSVVSVVRTHSTMTGWESLDAPRRRLAKPQAVE